MADKTATKDNHLIRSIASFINFFVSIVFFSILSGLFGFLPGLGASTWGIRSFGKLMLWLAGIELIVEGLEHIDKKRPAIYMANHSTILDIAILPAAIPVDLRFIFKQSLAHIPVVGWGMVLAGMIPIKRGSMGPAMKSLRKAAKRIQGGTHVGIFPEGTRTRTGELGSLKKGGFLLANLAQVPIIPVRVSDTSKICKRGIPYTRPGKLIITIHPPIPYSKENKKNREEIVNKVQALLG